MSMRFEGIGSRGPYPQKRLQVTDCIRREIVRGRWGGGERLPDRKWFQETLKAFPTTVQKAFDDLAADGFVVAVRGHGTHVANPLPYQDHYLMLLDDCRGQHQDKPFQKALAAAARELARTLRIRFAIEYIGYDHPDGACYERIMEDVRRHRYAGVFCQGVTAGRDVSTITNVNDVPIVFIGERDERTQGSLAVSLWSYARMDPAACIRMKFFDECRQRGVRRIAVFQGRGSSLGTGKSPERKYAAAAADCGLELVGHGFHSVEMEDFDAGQFKRLAGLFLDSSAGKTAEAVILADDNLIVPFAEVFKTYACCKKPDGGLLILSHCNFPLMPDTGSVPVTFHGLDLVETLRSVVEYARDCRNHVRKPRIPQFVVR